MTTSTLPVTIADVEAARERLRGVARHTPLLPYPRTAPRLPDEVWIKPESLQLTGSFKLRGAYNKIAGLSLEERARGVVTYSSGNHAQGTACAAALLGIRAVVVMPDNAPPVKVEGTRALGAEIVRCGPASDERQAVAEQLAAERGLVIVPPFDDPWIMAGQGTVGLEIADDLPPVEVVLVPVGGGGLISGVATAIKARRPQARVIGVEPALAADAQQSFREGHVVAWPAADTSRTLADGVRTQSLGALTYAVIRERVDDIVTVSEEDIRAAVRHYARYLKLVVEPTGALTLAALLSGAYAGRGQCVALVVSGGNIEPRVLASILNE
jgi:threonine dehydratase